MWLAIPNSLDVRSPAFEQAAAACRLGLWVWRRNGSARERWRAGARCGVRVRLVERQHDAGASSAECSLLGGAFFAFRSPRVPRNDGYSHGRIRKFSTQPQQNARQD